MLVIRNQNILVTLIPIVKSTKTFMKTLYQETTSRTATSELFSKIANMKKSQVHLCETEISLNLYKLLTVICLEFLSAFDRMDWDFIHTTQVGYSNIQSKIKINGV